MKTPKVQIIGPGKAGLSFYLALQSVGWDVLEPLGKASKLKDLDSDADFILITTPDKEIPIVAKALNKTKAVIIHTSGATQLDSLLPHKRRASLHPLVSMPEAEIGKERLLDDAWFAIDGDPDAERIVDALGGNTFRVTDDNRSVYHAAACIASNHLIVLMAQVQRLCMKIDIPFQSFLNLSSSTLAVLDDLNPAEALTGPAARGDEDTLKSHLESLPEKERHLYQCLAQGAKDLATQSIINESENI